MMIHPLLRRLSASILVLSVASMWLLQVTHVWLDAHHHEAHQVCDDHQHTISVAPLHFHDAHFLSDNCEWCDFILSAVAPPDLPWVIQRTDSAPVALSYPATGHIPVGFSGFMRGLRGPPLS